MQNPILFVANTRSSAPEDSPKRDNSDVDPSIRSEQGLELKSKGAETQPHAGGPTDYRQSKWTGGGAVVVSAEVQAELEAQFKVLDINNAGIRTRM